MRDRTYVLLQTLNLCGLCKTSLCKNFDTICASLCVGIALFIDILRWWHSCSLIANHQATFTDRQTDRQTDTAYIIKEPSSDSAQSEFTCSICNRQFRAKIGFTQPSTNTQTHINAYYSGFKMVFLSNER